MKRCTTSGPERTALPDHNRQYSDDNRQYDVVRPYPSSRTAKPASHGVPTSIILLPHRRRRAGHREAVLPKSRDGQLVLQH